MSNKKYKLFATGASGGKQPCAFFASPQGCRSGDACRFSHLNGNQASEEHEEPILHSAVSSESSDGEVTVDRKNPPTKSIESKLPPFVSVAATTIVTATADDSSPFLTASEAKMAAKKNKRGTSENPFANPNQTKKQKATPAHTAKATAAVAAATITGTTPKPELSKSPHPKSKSVTVVMPTAAATATPTPFSFLALDLPIASFTMPGKESVSVAAPSTTEPVDVVKSVPLPLSTPAGRKWLDVVKKTRSHPRYANSFDLSKYKEQDVTAGYSIDTWVKTLPFDVAKAGHPQIVAIDCEMCETQDPVSGRKDTRSLCRVSVVDVEKDEVLLDSLVKPMYPVTNYRTWVNGITAQNLENVQFTLRHAQAFMMALCTEETVILGHAVHNDLAALRLEHPTVGDSACLFTAADSDKAQVALRDLASHLFHDVMPEKHDSVNDARVAYQCLELYRTSEGKVDPIPRSPKLNSNRPGATGSQLFVHRIPKNVCDAAQLSQMFLAHTSVQPVSVDEFVFGDGTFGKTHVTFKSGKHSSLAFDSIEGNGEIDPSGRLQKKVYLRTGDYIRVRKMAFEKSKEEHRNSKEETTERRFSK